MPGNLWTDAELSVLREHYPTGGAQRVRRVLAIAGSVRSADAVRQKAQELGLKYESGPLATDGAVSVRLPPDELLALDRARGRQTRSHFIRQAVAKAIAGRA